MKDRIVNCLGGDKRYIFLGVLLLTAIIIFCVLQRDIILWVLVSGSLNFSTVLSAVFLFVIPGISIVLADRQLIGRIDVAEIASLAIAISLSLYPAILLISTLIGFRWNGWTCWIFIGFFVLFIIWRILHIDVHRKKIVLDKSDFIGRYYRWGVVSLFVAAIGISIRLYVARDLPGGMFGDSYHHTMIAQLIVDNGGLFSSWQPYAPLKTFTYHFGFHTLIAWLSMLSGATASHSLLIIGQIENGLTPLVIYAFTKRLTGNARAGVFAALCAGFVSLMPAYYVNWGRYTQLAGQTILPVACIAWMDLIDCASAEKRTDVWRRVALAVILTIGVALSHYRVAVFLGSFVVVYGIYGVAKAGKNYRASLRLLLWGCVAGFLAIAIVTPWLIRVHEGTLLRIANNFISKNIGSDESNSLPSVQDIFRQYIKLPLLALAALGVGYACWKRLWASMLICVWGGLVFLLANPYLLHLNGAGLITNFAVLIAVYIILSPLAGMGLELCVAFAQRLRLPKPWLDVVVFGCILATMHWSLGWQRQIIDPSYQIITKADLKAMEWIKTHVPSETSILVNAFPSYGGSMVAGIDGGWWIPLLTHHQTNVPPTIYGSEAAEDPEFLHHIRDINARIRELSFGSPEMPTYLHSLGFDYIYDGPTTSGQPSNIPVLISPDMLQHNDSYELLYQQDGVAIWKVR